MSCEFYGEGMLDADYSLVRGCDFHPTFNLIPQLFLLKRESDIHTILLGSVSFLVHPLCSFEDDVE